jgi:hypothetical protein
VPAPPLWRHGHWFGVSFAMPLKTRSLLRAASGALTVPFAATRLGSTCLRLEDLSTTPRVINGRKRAIVKESLDEKIGFKSRNLSVDFLFCEAQPASKVSK